ncbi:hypothetical protein PMAYCL1PPCAC_04014, partial [Pristionchus mayeri]
MQNPIILLVALSTAAALENRYVNIKGKLSCDDHYDDNSINGERHRLASADPYDTMAKVKPSSDGSFNVTGYEFEVSEAEFFLRIHHRCLIADRKDCPTLTDEFDLESSIDEKTIT